MRHLCPASSVGQSTRLSKCPVMQEGRGGQGATEALAWHSPRQRPAQAPRPGPLFCRSPHLETHNLGSERPGPTHVSGPSPALASVSPPRMVIVGLWMYASYPPTCWPMSQTSSGTSLGFRTLGGWMCHPPASPAKQPRRQIQTAQGACTPVTPCPSVAAPLRSWRALSEAVETGPWTPKT